MHSGKENETRYDDLRKPIKQTSFTVKKKKNLGRNLPEKQSTIIKRSFRSNTKPLSLDSTLPIDELTTETFYHIYFEFIPTFTHKYESFLVSLK